MAGLAVIQSAGGEPRFGSGVFYTLVAAVQGSAVVCYLLLTRCGPFQALRVDEAFHPLIGSPEAGEDGSGGRSGGGGVEAGRRRHGGGRGGGGKAKFGRTSINAVQDGRDDLVSASGSEGSDSANESADGGGRSAVKRRSASSGRSSSGGDAMMTVPLSGVLSRGKWLLLSVAIASGSAYMLMPGELPFALKRFSATSYDALFLWSNTVYQVRSVKEGGKGDASVDCVRSWPTNIVHPWLLRSFVNPIPNAARLPT